MDTTSLRELEAKVSKFLAIKEAAPSPISPSVIPKKFYGVGRKISKTWVIAILVVVLATGLMLYFSNKTKKEEEAKK